MIYGIYLLERFLKHMTIFRHSPILKSLFMLWTAITYILQNVLWLPQANGN